MSDDVQDIGRLVTAAGGFGDPEVCGPFRLLLQCEEGDVRITVPLGPQARALLEALDDLEDEQRQYEIGRAWRRATAPYDHERDDWSVRVKYPLRIADQIAHVVEVMHQPPEAS